MDNARPVDEMTFREASAELDGIIRQIESNTLELEDTLKAYERGVALIASLQKRLSEADAHGRIVGSARRPDSRYYAVITTNGLAQACRLPNGDSRAFF